VPPDKESVGDSTAIHSLWPQRPQEWALLTLVVGLACFARFFHLGHGLPEVVDVDSFKFVGEASRMLESGDTRPQDFQYPGAYTQLLRVTFQLFPIESFTARQFTARLFSAIAGVLTVLATYGLARKLGGPSAALIAGSLTAGSPLLLASSRAAATDSLVGLLMTLGIGLVTACRLNWLTACAFGLLVGLAAGTKYTGAFLAPWLIVALVLQAWPQRQDVANWWRNLAQAACAGALAVGTFLATTPWFLREWPRYLDRLRLETAIQRTGQIGHIQLGWFDYLVSRTPTCEQPWLGTSLLMDLGPLTFAAALGAMFFALAGRLGRALWILAAYVAVYLVLISGPGHVKAIRFLVPIVPALCIVLGCWISQVIARREWRPWVHYALAIGLVLWPAWNTTQFLVRATRPDTNELARAWAAEHLPAQSRLFLLPFYTDDLARLPLIVRSIPNSGSLQYRLPPGVGPNIESLPVYQAPLVDDLIQQGAQYVVISSAIADAYGKTPENLRWFPRSVEGFAGFLERLKERAEVMYSVEGKAAGRLGPDITIYRLMPANSN